MKAIVCHAPKDLRIDEMPDAPLEAKQLRVRVAFGGICGSDLHYFQHGGFGTIRIQHPMVLGHEVSGVVSAVGADVEGFTKGQKIAISPSRPCGLCMYCQKRQHNHCLDMRFYGSAMRMPHVHGAFADEFVIDQAQARTRHRLRPDWCFTDCGFAPRRRSANRGGGFICKRFKNCPRNGRRHHTQSLAGC